MRRIRQYPKGFTLLEIAIVVAIVAIVTVIAYSNLSRQTPRATLSSATAELQAAIHGARQTALASGNETVVLVFPDFRSRSSVGRFIIYEDGDFDMFTTARFVNYDPAVPSTGPRSQVIDTIDLPEGVTFGPATGLGTALPAPLNLVNVGLDCSFCGGTSPNRRGAIRFSARGAATFYDNSNPSAALPVIGGASFTLNAPNIDGGATLVITSSSGSVQVVKR